VACIGYRPVSRPSVHDIILLDLWGDRPLAAAICSRSGFEELHEHQLGHSASQMRIKAREALLLTVDGSESRALFAGTGRPPRSPPSGPPPDITVDCRIRTACAARSSAVFSPFS